MSNRPVGKYQVRVAPDQMEALKLQITTALAVEIRFDELFVSGADFLLQPIE